MFPAQTYLSVISLATLSMEIDG